MSQVQSRVGSVLIQGGLWGWEVLQKLSSETHISKTKVIWKSIELDTNASQACYYSNWYFPCPPCQTFSWSVACAPPQLVHCCALGGNSFSVFPKELDMWVTDPATGGIMQNWQQIEDNGAVCVTIAEAWWGPKFTFRLENNKNNANGKLYIQNAVGATMLGTKMMTLYRHKQTLPLWIYICISIDTEKLCKHFTLNSKSFIFPSCIHKST